MSFGRSDDPCYRRSFFVCKGDGVQRLEKRDPFPQKNNSFDTFFIGFLACVQTSPISFVARVHAGNRFPESRFLFPKYSSLNSSGGFRRGEGTAPPPPPPPPYFGTKLRPEGPTHFFGRPGPSLSQGLDPALKRPVLQKLITV